MPQSRRRNPRNDPPAPVQALQNGGPVNVDPDRFILVTGKTPTELNGYLHNLSDFEGKDGSFYTFSQITFGGGFWYCTAELANPLGTTLSDWIAERKESSHGKSGRKASQAAS